MADRIPMTPRGVRALKNELKNLREVERPKNVQDIEEARAHGDLRENAEFHAAKEKQSFIAGRLAEVESLIAQSEVIDPGKLSGDRVVFGATVELVEVENEETITYEIVGDHEADIKRNWIAISAPITRALIGREVGETVVVRKGAHSREYQIRSVRFITQEGVSY